VKCVEVGANDTHLPLQPWASGEMDGLGPGPQPGVISFGQVRVLGPTASVVGRSAVVCGGCVDSQGCGVRAGSANHGT
jgi:hypothetical protein